MQPSASVKTHQPVLSSEDFLNLKSGFILHPRSSPIILRALPIWQQWRWRHQSCHGPAILCSAPCYLRTGCWAEIRIPMRDSKAIFIARVVLIRALPNGYEAGLQLTDTEQGARLRIVEQFCHMQHYCENSGNLPTSNAGHRHEQQARDWVRLNADRFPVL